MRQISPEEVERQTRRSNTRLGCLALIVLGGGTVITVLSLICYFFSLGFDVPVRIQGHYEKGLTLSSRPFAFAPDGKIIIFGSTETGHGDLYTADRNGKNVRRLTSDPAYESDAFYSPNGRSIVFSRETHFCGHIWIMDADGGNQRQLTSGTDYDDGSVFTTEGDHIWFQRTPAGTSPGHFNTFSMTADGKKVVPVGALPSKKINDFSISPQDKSIFYTIMNAQGKDEIWQVQPDGEKRNYLTSGAHPSISPEGKEVAYLAGPYENEVWMMKPDGSQQHQVYPSESTKRFVSFTPDSHQLAFLEETSHGTFISMVNTDGSDYRRLINVFHPIL